jgi:hypothetical protein
LNTRFNTVTDSQYEPVHWYHFAVMELLKTTGARIDIEWIGKSLGIKSDQVKDALDFLQKFEIIKIRENSEIEILRDYIALPSGKPLSAARTLHHDVLKKAERALEE